MTKSQKNWIDWMKETQNNHPNFIGLKEGEPIKEEKVSINGRNFPVLIATLRNGNILKINHQGGIGGLAKNLTSK